MKVTFTPLDPKPVRVPDMPDGVEYEILGVLAGEKQVRINHDGGVWDVDAEGKPNHRLLSIIDFSDKKVLCRRDGKPLPGSEPVPLDTLEPFPVWYRGVEGDYYYSCDGRGGFTAYKSDDPYMWTEEARKISVYPQPYIMEVQR